MGRMTSHIWWKKNVPNHQPVMVLGIHWIRIQMPPNSPGAGSWSCAFCKLLIRDVTVLTLTAPRKQRSPIKIQSFKLPLSSQDFTPSFWACYFRPTQLLQDFSQQPLSGISQPWHRQPLQIPTFHQTSTKREKKLHSYPFHIFHIDFSIDISTFSLLYTIHVHIDPEFLGKKRVASVEKLMRPTKATAIPRGSGTEHTWWRYDGDIMVDTLWWTNIAIENGHL